MSATIKFSQKAFIYHRVEFTFFDKHLDYKIEDEKSGLGFSILYDSIPLKKSFQTYREKWSYYILLAIFPAIIMNFHFASISSFNNPTAQVIFWVSIAGILILNALHQVPKFQADVIETPQGKILIFDRPHRQEIIDEIYRRRTAELRRKHLAIDPFNNPQAEIQKFRQLKEENIITGQEYATAVEKLLVKQDKP